MKPMTREQKLMIAECRIANVYHRLSPLFYHPIYNVLVNDGKWDLIAMPIMKKVGEFIHPSQWWFERLFHDGIYMSTSHYDIDPNSTNPLGSQIIIFVKIFDFDQLDLITKI